MQNIKSREIFSTSGLINTVKTGLNGVFEILNDKLNGGSTNTDIELLKLYFYYLFRIFNEVDDKCLYNNEVKVKINEVLYLLSKNKMNFSIFKED